LLNLIKSIVEHEGFSPVAYPDPLTKGKPYTFGHGLTSITEAESIEIVKNRIVSIRAQLSTLYPPYAKLPEDVRDILEEMAYQMGIKGLMAFKNTLIAISNKDYKTASTNMMNSLWAKQTPKRAQTLATRMANIKG